MKPVPENKTPKSKADPASSRPNPSTDDCCTDCGCSLGNGGHSIQNEMIQTICIMINQKIFNINWYPPLAQELLSEDENGFKIWITGYSRIVSKTEKMKVESINNVSTHGFAALRTELTNWEKVIEEVDYLLYKIASRKGKFDPESWKRFKTSKEIQLNCCASVSGNSSEDFRADCPYCLGDLLAAVATEKERASKEKKVLDEEDVEDTIDKQNEENPQDDENGEDKEVCQGERGLEDAGVAEATEALENAKGTEGAEDDKAELREFYLLLESLRSLYEESKSEEKLEGSLGDVENDTTEKNMDLTDKKEGDMEVSDEFVWSRWGRFITAATTMCNTAPAPPYGVSPTQLAMGVNRATKN